MRKLDRQPAMAHPAYALLLSLVQARVPAFQGRDTGNALWAFAKLPAAPPKDLISSLSAALERNMPAITCRDLAEGSWGMATLRYNASPSLLVAIGHRATALFNDSRHVSYMLC